ncbi:MAG: hypoxanthine phosphoribosyltransferase [Ruminococcaceae bacterium]|nr:hypoxanthine phosphoribosyltransferase [Oscillospiraceae bacterium]
MHKDCEYILLSEEKIKEIVREMAQKISEDYKDKNLILVGLLKGSVMFMSDLMKELSIDCSIDFICASSYGAGTESSGRVNIVKDVSQPLDGKDVLIVEDIIDSGNTLNFITKYFGAKNAASVRICTMLSKPDRRVVDIPVDYVGMEVPDEFVIGYGLDYAEKYRNLPYIGVLKPSVYS